MKAYTIEDGEGAVTYGGGLYLACCDCALRHFLLVEPEGRGFRVRFWRDQYGKMLHRAEKKRQEAKGRQKKR